MSEKTPTPAGSVAERLTKRLLYVMADWDGEPETLLPAVREAVCDPVREAVNDAIERAAEVVVSPLAAKAIRALKEKP